MAKKSASINLLKTGNNETVDAVINWALTIGRLLIIIVEVVALSALIYRFILDAQLRDINSRIEQDKAVLESQKKNEETFRNLQDRLALEASINDQADGEVKILKDVISYAPSGMTFTNITTGTNGVKITANVNSVFPLSVFINSLKKYPKTDSISIDKIENKTASALITVGISVNLKGQGGVNANSGN